MNQNSGLLPRTLKSTQSGGGVRAWFNQPGLGAGEALNVAGMDRGSDFAHKSFYNLSRNHYEVHASEVYASEMHACEVHAYETHTHEVCAHEMNA